MLNTVSCWHVDWVTIGTWVGGIGASAAAIAAVWTVRTESSRRAKFAKFLLEKDIERLEELHCLLLSMASDLDSASFVCADTGEGVEWELPFEKAQERYTHLLNDFEYFKSSEQQFAYRPCVKEFGLLQSVVRNLEDQLNIINAYGFDIDEGAAADEARLGAKKVKEAVDALKAAIQLI